MHAQSEIDTHVSENENWYEWPQQEVMNSMNILFDEIKRVRKVISDGIEVFTRKS